MIKRIIVILSALIMLALSTLTYADDFDGFFVGAQTGFYYSNFDWDSSINFMDPSSPTNVTWEHDGTGSAITPIIGGLFGYGRLLSPRFYLGGLLQGYYGNAQRRITFTAISPLTIAFRTNVNVDVEGGLGIYIRPGVLINPNNLFFIIAGWGFSEVEVRSNSLLNSATTILVRQVRLSRSEFMNGPSVGAGFESQLYHHWFLQLMFVFTHLLNNITVTGQQDVLPNPILNGRTKVDDVNIPTFSLAFTYHF